MRGLVMRRYFLILLQICSGAIGIASEASNGFTLPPGFTLSPAVTNFYFTTATTTTTTKTPDGVATPTVATNPTTTTTIATTTTPTTTTITIPSLTPPSVPIVSSSTTTTTTPTTTTTTTTTTSFGTNNITISSLTPPPVPAVSSSTTTTTTATPLTYSFLLVFKNQTSVLANLSEINSNITLDVKNQLAQKLNVDNNNIADDIIVTKGGVKLVKRDVSLAPNNDVTVRFDVTSRNASQIETMKNNLKMTVLNVNGSQLSNAEVYSWTARQNCSNKPCSEGQVCDVRGGYYNDNNATIVNYSYKTTCVAATTQNEQQQNKLLYLLLLLLLIPIAILIITIAVWCHKRKRDEHPYINSYSRKILKSPHYTNHAFGTVKSDKSDIIIMGNDTAPPPTYETHPRSGNQPGTVNSSNSRVFDNNLFTGDDSGVGTKRSGIRTVQESTRSAHPVSDGEKTMAFSYMQMRNSKINDDSHGLF